MGLAEKGADRRAAVLMFETIALGLAALYCLVRVVVDFGQRRHAWGVAGILCVALLLSIPIETHAVKLDLPAPAGR